MTRHIPIDQALQLAYQDETQAAPHHRTTVRFDEPTFMRVHELTQRERRSQSVTPRSRSDPRSLRAPQPTPSKTIPARAPPADVEVDVPTPAPSSRQQILQTLAQQQGIRQQNIPQFIRAVEQTIQLQPTLSLQDAVLMTATQWKK